MASHYIILHASWGFYTNEIINISTCYESVIWLQSHMLPCNSGETPVFWNPVPGGEGSLPRMCADPRCHDPMFWPAELSEWSCVCRTFWFVELVNRTCVADARNPDVNSFAVNQRQYRTFDVNKWLQLGVREHSRVCTEVSTILGAVMDSRNSKTIELPWSDSGRWSCDDLKQVVLHILPKFSGFSLNAWWFMARTSSGLLTDTRPDKHTQTGAGNDNTRRPKVASGKDQQIYIL